MSTNLATLFPSIELLSECPNLNETYTYIFHNEKLNCWMTIDKNEVSDREYALLCSLFQEVKPAGLTNESLAEKWIKFLHDKGPVPLKKDTEIRIIQLHFNVKEAIESHLEEAVKLFFDDAMRLIFISSEDAVLIEEKSSYIHTLDDFSSFIVALESDFFITVKMYIGKFHPTTQPFASHFITEQKWFFKGLSRNRAEQIYSMQNTFPFILIDQISEELKQIIHKEILEPIEYDMELLQSVQLLFENGFNASVAAKKLHVHRNTLQYRLSKFQVVTDINVRNFDGALVAYCASLIAMEEYTNRTTLND
ncbi:PucR family transcriptional regulator [Psychrobacillus sp. NPDC093180]|uniref:PucR family transcriptional regulator n=1 Tax=Psychrobacillus sp. NPDC093180 TaxID=3364489 RepID=UPI0037F6424F